MVLETHQALEVVQLPLQCLPLPFEESSCCLIPQMVLRTHDVLEVVHLPLHCLPLLYEQLGLFSVHGPPINMGCGNAGVPSRPGRVRQVVCGRALVSADETAC